jgi:hypothetical protein
MVEVGAYSPVAVVVIVRWEPARPALPGAVQVAVD